MYRHLEFLRLGAVCALYPLYDPIAGAYSRENWCDLQPRQRGRPAGGAIGGAAGGAGGGGGGGRGGGRARGGRGPPPLFFLARPARAASRVWRAGGGGCRVA